MANAAPYRASTTPMLWVLAPFVAGITAAEYIELPLWVSMLCLGAMLIAAALSLLWRKPGVGFILGSLFFLGISLSAIGEPQRSLPTGRSVYLRLRLTEEPLRSGKWNRADGQVLAFGDGERWQGASERVQVYIDTSYRVGVFRDVVCRGYVVPIDTMGSSYGRLMAVRGYFNRIYVSPGGVVGVATEPARPLRYYAVRMQSWVVERLARLDLPDNQADVVRTMVAGSKRGIDKELRDDYSLTGAAHLLAVSGLHVGIVFVLINILLMPLALLRAGHLWRNVIAILVIFTYAFMTGMSPSVMRAALMFSLAQVAMAASATRSPLNIMLFSAFVLLVVDTGYLFDVSFQLSYAAVLSILIFYNPLYSLIRSRFKLLNIVSGVMVVGLTASVGTAPLVAYYFGNFPLVGLLLNLPVIFTAHVIVMVGVAWVVAPLPLLKPVAAWILGSAAGFQNAVVEWGAGLRWAGLSVEMPLWAVLLCYVVIVGFAWWYYRQTLRSSIQKN